MKGKFYLQNRGLCDGFARKNQSDDRRRRQNGEGVTPVNYH